jgi:hypothetical protein
MDREDSHNAGGSLGGQSAIEKPNNADAAVPIVEEALFFRRWGRVARGGRRRAHAEASSLLPRLLDASDRSRIVQAARALESEPEFVEDRVDVVHVKLVDQLGPRGAPVRQRGSAGGRLAPNRGVGRHVRQPPPRVERAEFGEPALSDGRSDSVDV